MLHKVLHEKKDELSELIEGRIVNIFYLFSQAENYVKEVVADWQVLKSTFVHRSILFLFSFPGGPPLLLLSGPPSLIASLLESR